ncbi:hypothetical protein [Arthrobacter sp. ISL-95]|uniref:hypothetical protein n=1 Tax=Arthrobacter sp. ISL-95 TaxID=2819116 RepID=UPI001BE4EEE6|nr:hypothetical protein [Arthrobacter sp. ISL-95]MBT2587961.1 hypothetical protein [Arthrobacter sp. ISL-95]
MDTFITRYPVAFTNAAANLPLIRPAAPSAGIPGYSYRYIPSRSALGHGAAVASLTNEATGGAALAQAVTGARPLLQRVGDEAWMKFDGTDDFMNVGTIAATGTFTFALVMRVRSQSDKTLVNLTTSGSPVSQMVGGATKLDIRYGSTILAVPSPTPADGSWHFAMASLNGASSVITMDAKTASGTVGAASVTGLALGNSLAGVGFADYDVAELIAWPTAMTTAQAQTVRAAMIANHPTLLS